MTRRPWMETYDDGGMPAENAIQIEGTDFWAMHLKTGQCIGIAYRDLKKPSPRCCGKANPWWVIYPDGTEGNAGHDKLGAFTTLHHAYKKRHRTVPARTTITIGA